MVGLFKRVVLLVSLATTVVFASGSGYPNNNILISAEEAVKLIGKPNVMFVSGDNPDAYRLGHIKGSVEMYAHHLHHADIMGNLHCEPLYQCIDQAEKHIGEKGISNDMLVIAYDNWRGPNATGVYSFFASYGHKKLKILNGGRDAIMKLDPAQKEYDKVYDEYKEERKVGKKASKELKDAKRGKIKISDERKKELKTIEKASKKKQKALKKQLAKIEKNLLVVKGEEKVTPKTYTINKKDIDLKHIAGHEEMVHAMEDIRKNGDASKYVIVDARSMIEIIGERKMDNVARGGHVPGATFLEWKHVSDAQNELSFQSADKLEEVFKYYGISKDKTIYAYCQVGAGRGSEIITALQLLNYPNVKVFTGSWDYWGNHMNLPIKR